MFFVYTYRLKVTQQSTGLINLSYLDLNKITQTAIQVLVLDKSVTSILICAIQIHFIKHIFRILI